MVLHFERLRYGHTGAQIILVYHPTVPEDLLNIALSTRRNLDGKSTVMGQGSDDQ